MAKLVVMLRSIRAFKKKKITQYKAASKLDLLPLGVCAEHQNQSLLVACFSSTRLAVDLSYNGHAYLHHK